MSKFEDYTDEELKCAINQLQAEVAIGPGSEEELREAQEVANERGLFY